MPLTTTALRDPESIDAVGITARTVSDAMVTDVRIHGPGTTVRELREFFADGHVHSAVVVDDGVVLAVVDRADLHESLDGDTAAIVLGCGTSRVLGPDAGLEDARQLLLATGRRRLVVVDAGGRFRGLLCLKRTRAGFCSAQDVRARAAGRPHRGRRPGVNLEPD